MYQQYTHWLETLKGKDRLEDADPNNSVVKTDLKYDCKAEGCQIYTVQNRCVETSVNMTTYVGSHFCGEFLYHRSVGWLDQGIGCLDP